MGKGTFDYEELLVDVTERRRQLAELVMERDRLVEELRLAKEALETEQDSQYGAYSQLVELERVRAFDDVARGIEHDLFDALTPVEGYTELLLMNPARLADPERAREYLNAILEAAREAKLIIEHLREFYYSTASLDIQEHRSVSGLLATLLDQGSGEASGEADDAEAVIGTEALSPREWDVLKLLSNGMKNRDIAETLSVSENTVKTHIKAILSKLSLGNRTQAAAYALLDQHAFEPGPHAASG